MKKIFFVLISGLLVFTTSCDSSEDDGPNQTPTAPTAIQDGEVTASDQEQLKLFLDGGEEKEWGVRGFTLAGQVNQFTTCRLDDLFTFNADGTYFFDRGEVPCGGEDDQQTRTGTWEVSFENGTITFDKDTPNEEIGEIVGVTETELRVEGSYMLMEVRGLFSPN